MYCRLAKENKHNQKSTAAKDELVMGITSLDPSVSVPAPNLETNKSSGGLEVILKHQGQLLPGTRQHSTGTIHRVCTSIQSRQQGIHRADTSLLCMDGPARTEQVQRLWQHQATTSNAAAAPQPAGDAAGSPQQRSQDPRFGAETLSWQLSIPRPAARPGFQTYTLIPT